MDIGVGTGTVLPEVFPTVNREEEGVIIIVRSAALCVLDRASAY
jgi:hypothetical protein